MKMWLLYTLIAAVPFYLAAMTAEAGEPGCDGEAKIVVVKCEGEGDNVNCVHSGDGDGAEILVEVLGDGPNDFHWIADGGEGHRIIIEADGHGDETAFATAVIEMNGDDDGHGFAFVAGEDDDSNAKHKIRLLRGQLAGAQKGAFLGVNLTSSSSNDGKNEGGVRISGVVDDGPAAAAGLRAGDVVLAIGDDSVTSGMSALTKALRAREPGDEVQVVVLREGEEVSFSVTLGSRGSIATNFAFGPGGIGQIEDNVKARGHMVLRNGDGDWEVKDLGDLEALKDLPQNIRMFMPKMGSRSISISDEGGEKVISINRSSDGETLAIEQRGGEITITRVDVDGEETTDTYANKDELKTSDEEAFDLLEGGTGNVWVFDQEGTGDEDGTFDFHFDVDTNDFHEDIAQWRGELDGTLGEAREAFELAMEELGTLKEGLHDQHREKFDRLHHLFEQDGEGKNLRIPGAAHFEFLTKPKHTFEVRSDGTIEVKIRKGDSELVQLFDDPSDMEDREPALYEKYSKLMNDNE